jgi:hypothetical protein
MAATTYQDQAPEESGELRWIPLDDILPGLGRADAFPRRDAHWFPGLVRPLRTDTGGGPQVTVRFFRLLAEHSRAARTPATCAA